MARTDLEEALGDCSLCRDDIAEKNFVHVFGTDRGTLEGSCVFSVGPADLRMTI